MIITLTTDLGSKDSYVPAVKGSILRKLPTANIVDITHQVQAFNIGEAAFILKGCYRDFPEGTVHVVSIDAETNQNPRFVLIQTPQYYFIAYDNGLVSLALEENEPILQVFELEYNEADLIFPLKNILAPAAARLLAGEELLKIGKLTREYDYRRPLMPVMHDAMIRGQIIYIDHIGNAITNISKKLFDECCKGRKYLISLRRTETIDELLTHYSQVEEGERVCLFGTHGNLEIAINKGNANGLLGLPLGHPILIEFEES